MFIVRDYTIVMAVLWASMAVLAAVLLLRRNDCPWLVGLILGLAILRLAFPVQYLGNPVFRDRWVLPTLMKFVRTEFWEGFSVKEALLWLWLLGSCIGLVYHIWQMVLIGRVRKRAKTVESTEPVAALYEETAAGMGWKKPTRLAISDNFSSPVSVGLFRPCILLPRFYKGYTDEQLSHMLAHEIGHHKRGDLWRIQGIWLLQCALWWHPCVWLLGRAMRNDLEIQCDKLACKKMDKVQRTAYYGTVLHALKLSKQNAISGVMQLVGAAEKKSLKHRIQIAFKSPKMLSKPMTTAIVSLCLVTFIMSYILVFQPAFAAPTGSAEAGYTQEEMSEADWVEENEATPFILYMNGQYSYMVNGIETRILSEEDLQLPEYADLEIIVANGG